MYVSGIFTSLRHLLWWCAADDCEEMERSTRRDQLNASIGGVLVLLTALVAGMGWGYKIALVAYDAPYRLPIGICGGAFMATFVFVLERMLLASISPSSSHLGRLWALGWRSVMGGFSAALLSLPVLLVYFATDIAGYLDDQRLVQLKAKRTEIDELFGLPRLEITGASISKAIEANDTKYQTLPDHVRKLEAEAERFEREYGEAQARISPLIAQARFERDALSRGLERHAGGEEKDGLQRQVASLNAYIAKMSQELSVKNARWKGKAQEAGQRRNEYLDRVATERVELEARKADYENAAQEAKRKAKETLTVSEEIVRRRTGPTLSAQGGALFDLIGVKHFVTLVSALFFGWFWMVELLPIMSKLVHGGVYEKRLRAQEVKATAELEAQVSESTAIAEEQKMHASERIAGFQRFHEESQGELVLQEEKLRCEMQIDEAHIKASYDIKNVVIDAMERSIQRRQDLRRRYGSDPGAMAELDQIDALAESARARAFSEFERRRGQAA